MIATMSDFRLLIVSNNCLSRHNSNGRTLLNMLSGFKSENLFQIYTSGEYIDERYCISSYRITNRDVINSYRGIEPSNQQIAATEDSAANRSEKLSSKKNAATMLLRDLAWDHSRKLSNCIMKWAEDKKPDAVLLQLGDSTHIIHIAVELVKRLGIPLITYNTEDYYFKDYDFMKQSIDAGIIYKIFHNRFCREYKAMMKQNPTCIYNCEGLKEIYDKEFGTQSNVVFCSTDMKPVETIHENGGILYAGNLGVGRHLPLIEIGAILYEKGLHIDVYGSATEEVRLALENADGVRYHGFVDYEENCHNISNSRLLVHVEGFDEYFSRDTRFAFSTKIADCCASGVPVFMYAPKWCESTQYAINYDFAFVVSEKSALRHQLQLALDDTELRHQKVKNARYVANLNHQMDENERQVLGIIENACCMK